MSAPVFISTDVAALTADIITQYEALAGVTLQPAQAERLIIDVLAYREGLLRSSIQGAAEQMLVSFANAPMLDYLGELVGVLRLPAAPAEVDLEFTLGVHTGVTIPAGTRVTTTDGLVIFATNEAANVLSGVTSATVAASCLTAGEAGNGYTAGTVNVIMDVQAFLTSVTTSDTTAGGADAETDEALRTRIKLASGQYSNAGSVGAYKYWTISASPAIIDAAIISPGDGEVEVYPLMGDGSATPSPVLTAVETALNSDTVRPLTDLVTVIAPTRTTYTLDVELILYDTADIDTVTAQVEDALDTFVLAKRSRLGLDIILSSIHAAATVTGVYSVEVVGWTDIICVETEFAYCTAITVSVTSQVAG